MVVEDDVDVDQIHVDQRLFSPLSFSTTINQVHTQGLALSTSRTSSSNEQGHEVSILFFQCNDQVYLTVITILALRTQNRQLHQAPKIGSTLLWRGTANTFKTLRIETSGPRTFCGAYRHHRLSQRELNFSTQYSDLQCANTTRRLSDILCDVVPLFPTKAEVYPLSPSLPHIHDLYLVVITRSSWAMDAAPR